MQTNSEQSQTEKKLERNQEIQADLLAPSCEIDCQTSFTEDDYDSESENTRKKHKRDRKMSEGTSDDKLGVDGETGNQTLKFRAKNA